jgi:hypothetical protein
MATQRLLLYAEAIKNRDKVEQGKNNYFISQVFLIITLKAYNTLPPGSSFIIPMDFNCTQHLWNFSQLRDIARSLSLSDVDPANRT